MKSLHREPDGKAFHRTLAPEAAVSVMLAELLDLVTVPMGEHRPIPARESRLLVRDGVQRNGRIGDDPRAVVAGDLAVQFGAVCRLNAFTLDALCGRADLALRLQCDALFFQAAMVDACVNVEFGKAFVGKLGPAFPPELDHFGAVPLPHLRAETVLVHGPHGQHDIGVGLGQAILARRKERDFAL
jgi:hypothetical protein